MKRTIIIGGGPAGMFAAVTAAEKGAEVVLIEQNKNLGKKLLITGNGRCNITTANWNLSGGITRNADFIKSAFSRFNNYDVIDFFENRKLKIKYEGEKVFPLSDKADDVLGVLIKELDRLHIKIIKDRAIDIAVKNNKVSGVVCEKGTYNADNVVVATGGLSYPQTGSKGDGYKIAKKLGHNVTKLTPNLVSFVLDSDVSSLQGICLSGFMRIYKDNKSIYSSFGDIVYTSKGITGPVIIEVSDKIEDGKYHIEIDLMPDISENELDDRVLEMMQDNANKNIDNILSELLPKKIVSAFLADMNIENKKANQLKKDERKKIVHTIKNKIYDIKSLGGFNEAIITKGGIDTKEIDPRTMESKIVSNLYFVGEVLDIHGLCGGYNLQVAWSTGYAAAMGIIENKKN